MTELLCLILGLILGFYGWTIYSKLRGVYELFKDKLESPPGAVKAEFRRVTKGQQISDDSEAGGILPPSPIQYQIQNAKEREERLRNL